MTPARKRALVTGASGGIGAEFARVLAAEGYDLVLTARSAERLEIVGSSLRATYGVEVAVVVADLSDAGAIERIAARVDACDVLVNNAGAATRKRFERIAPERIAAELALDIVAPTLLTRQYLPGMLARGHGRILNVASTAGLIPGPFMAAYYASKAYLISFSQAIAEEVRGLGVTVTCLCPGATATGFAQRAGTHGTLLFRLPVANAHAMARAGYRGMLAGKDLVIPGPLPNRLVDLGARLLPRRLLLWMSRKAVEIDDDA